MRILFVSSEVAPFAKVGGLGDVSFALPRALAAQGHDVRVVMPHYRRVRENGHEVSPRIPALPVQLGQHRLHFQTLETTLPDSEVPVYMIDCPPLYDRAGVYTQDGDEHLRFAMLNWAALRVAQQIRFSPHIVHANDWQTSLLPLMLKTVFAWDRLFRGARTTLTIHNLGHQGTFPASVLPDLGLAEVAQHFHQEELQKGRLSFMLSGILYADAITTVSPTYARQILTPEHGVGLDPYLRIRESSLRGILNGIDGDEWSPEKDRYIPYRYSADEPSDKVKNKKQLLKTVGLPYRPGVPLISVVSRLVWQKGLDLCFDALPALLAQREVQVVILGMGEPRYESFFRRLADHAPRRVAFKNGYTEKMAHLVEAGSDIFLMPSRYEPCGLNQMYSLAYGTPPIVHGTGGLADTVEQWNPRTQNGNGFVFDHFDVTGLKWALGAALDVFDNRRAWRQLMDNGMRAHLDWTHRVRDYERLYMELCA